MVMDPTVQSTLDLLRRAKSLNEVEGAFHLVLQFVSTCLPGTNASLSATAAATRTEVRGTLLTISILVGALCRRVGQLFRLQTINTAYEAEPNEDAALHFKRKVDTAMGRLSSALEPLRVRMQARTTDSSTAKAAPTPPIAGAASRGNGLLNAPTTTSSTEWLSDTLFYGMGELCDYYAHRRADIYQLLLSTLRRPHWEPKTVVELILWLQHMEERMATWSSTEQRHTVLAQGGVAAVNMRAPLRDPLSRLPLQLPARGPHCTHIAVFDLTSLVQVAQQQRHQQQQVRQSTALTPAGQAAARSTVAMTCPICRSAFELPEVRVDVEARAALHAFYQEHPIETLNVDQYALTWNVEPRTVTISLREARGGEKRTVASVDPDADRDERADVNVRKAARTE